MRPPAGEMRTRQFQRKQQRFYFSSMFEKNVPPSSNCFQSSPGSVRAVIKQRVCDLFSALKSGKTIFRPELCVYLKENMQPFITDLSQRQTLKLQEQLRDRMQLRIFPVPKVYLHE